MRKGLVAMSAALAIFTSASLSAVHAAVVVHHKKIYHVVHRHRAVDGIAAQPSSDITSFSSSSVLHVGVNHPPKYR
jgi:hypothetical protein